jgi:sigma-B regulation protein RsbU (phosphoserine phosphatase)
LLNAGHLPPLLIQNDRIVEMPKGSTAIGLAAGTVFAEQEITLQPGEIFIGYTDGLVESRNSAGEFFGEERLKNILYDFAHLSPEHLATRIFTSIHNFVNETAKHDDLSLVIIKRSS